MTSLPVVPNLTPITMRHPVVGAKFRQIFWIGAMRESFPGATKLHQHRYVVRLLTLTTIVYLFVYFVCFCCCFSIYIITLLLLLYPTSFKARKEGMKGYVASDHSDSERGNYMGYSFRLAAMVLLYAPSHRQDSTYHGLCYTSRGALAGKRNSSMNTP